MRVIFKDEDDWRGEPIGPVVVVMDGEEPFASRPFQQKCVCGHYDDRRLRATERNRWGHLLCPDCGDELPIEWLTLSQAEALAGEHGVELEVS